MLVESSDEDTITVESKYQDGETEDSEEHCDFDEVDAKDGSKDQDHEDDTDSQTKNGPTLKYMVKPAIGFQNSNALTASLEMMHISPMIPSTVSLQPPHHSLSTSSQACCVGNPHI